jgi:NADPH:quinone reductase-like Zn-dependent oxidoreductase
VRAAVITDFAKQPIVGEFDDPAPVDGEVIADVRAAAVSNLVRLVAGRPHFLGAQHPPLVAGIDGVAELPNGELVYVPGVRSPWGTLAEKVAVPLAAALPVPEGLPAVQAAAVVNAAAAAWLPLLRIMETRVPVNVVVLGATGASGSIAVQIAKHLGAQRVIAVGREGDKLRRTADHGADVVIPIDTDLGPALTRAAEGGVDVVLDFVWGDAATVTMTAAAGVAPSPAHRIDWVNIGSLGGTDIPISATLLRAADLHVWGSGAGAYSGAERGRVTLATLDLAARGTLQVDIEERPLSDLDTTWSAAGRSVYVP